MSIRKDGNAYKAEFTHLYSKSSGYNTYATGDTLTARLENALQKIHPNDFAYKYWEQTPDLLRAELGQETQIEQATEESPSTPAQTDDTTMEQEPVSEEFRLNQEDLEYLYDHVTGSKAERVESDEPGVHRFKVYGNNDYSDLDFTVTRSPVNFYEKSLLGTREPVRGDEGWKVVLTSDMLAESMDLQVDLADIETLYPNKDDYAYAQTALEEDKQSLAVEIRTEKDDRDRGYTQACCGICPCAWAVGFDGMERLQDIDTTRADNIYLGERGLST